MTDGGNDECCLLRTVPGGDMYINGDDGGNDEC